MAKNIQQGVVRAGQGVASVDKSHLVIGRSLRDGDSNLTLELFDGCVGSEAEEQRTLYTD